jgi:hypothetical protein
LHLGRPLGESSWSVPSPLQLANTWGGSGAGSSVFATREQPLAPTSQVQLQQAGGPHPGCWIMGSPPGKRLLGSPGPPQCTAKKRRPWSGSSAAYKARMTTTSTHFPSWVPQKAAGCCGWQVPRDEPPGIPRRVTLRGPVPGGSPGGSLAPSGPDISEVPFCECCLLYGGHHCPACGAGGLHLTTNNGLFKKSRKKIMCQALLDDECKHQLR